jgi:hypothetical protein
VQIISDDSKHFFFPWEASVQGLLIPQSPLINFISYFSLDQQGLKAAHSLINFDFSFTVSE